MSYPLRAPSRIRGSDFFRGVALAASRVSMPRRAASFNSALSFLLGAVLKAFFGRLATRAPSTASKEIDEQERGARLAPTCSLVQDETEHCRQRSRAGGSLRPAHASRPLRPASARGSAARANQRPHESRRRDGMQRKQEQCLRRGHHVSCSRQSNLFSRHAESRAQQRTASVDLTLRWLPPSLPTLDVAGEG
jgi:hypothetical protein